MDAVYPSAASALARGRRLRRAEPRARHRTTPVTFAEIQEVDEENEEARLEECAAQCAVATGECGATRGEGRRRPRHDLLEERLGRQFAEFRRRRARPDALREREPDSPPPAPAPIPTPAPPPPPPRAGSEPAAERAADAHT